MHTISLFRKNHLDAFADVFVQVLCLAKAAGLVRPGRHRRDQGPGQCLAAQGDELWLHDPGSRPAAGQINELLKQARDVDAEEDAVFSARRGDELPEELRRRQDRLATIEAAMKRLEAEAEPRLMPNGSVARKPKPSGNAPGRSVIMGPPVRSWIPPRRRPRPTSAHPTGRS